ncbi:MAG: hypothetical protein ACI3Y2_04650 [Candidatus Egerieousia sp.]
MEKTLSVNQLLKVRHETISLPGMWEECTGPISRSGVVFVWGNSGNGKTSVVLDLCKKLTEFGKVMYASLEEGYAESFQRALLRSGVVECGARLQILRKTSIDELFERLAKPRSPQFVAIDSYQYLHLSYRQYLELRSRFRNKLLIFVSHADGKQPEGRAARSVMYDADLKLWVEGYTVFSKGRYIGKTGRGVIWQEGAQKYWGTTTTE